MHFGWTVLRQTTILQGSLEIAHEILFDLIGVGCFTRGRNALLGTLLLVLTLQLTCTVVMHIYGHVHPSGELSAVRTWMGGTV